MEAWMSKTKLDRLLRGSDGQLDQRQRKAALKLLQEDKKRVDNMLAADQLSGAGYPMDQQLRRILQMANDDSIRGSDYPLRNLWDVFRGFVLREECAIGTILRLRPERDHAFDANDFFAFASDPAIKDATVAKMQSLPEGVIHNYSILTDPKDVVFEQEDGDPIILLGIALIRHGNHLYWQSSGGYVVDLPEVTAARRAELARDEQKIRSANPNSSDQVIRDILNPTARSLPGAPDVWDCSTFGMFDLSTQSHEIRASTRDWTISQAVFTDQFEERLADLYEVDEAARRLVDKAMAQIERDKLLFEVAEVAFALPAYFAARVQFVKKQEMKTQLANPKDQRAKYALKAPPVMRVQTRLVSTLDYGSTGGSKPKSFTPPRFRVEVDGYYRRLSPDGRGFDKDGNALTGMTWVTKHARWKDRPFRIGVVRVKSAITSALRRVKNIGVLGSEKITVS
jgi:hypothetical protein